MSEQRETSIPRFKTESRRKVLSLSRGSSGLLLWMVCQASVSAAALPPVLKPDLASSGRPTGATQNILGENSRGGGQLRLKGFSEMMFPALRGTGVYVPTPKGRPFVPAFLSSQVGLDYEVAPELRVFYLQKALVIWPAQPGQAIRGRFLDPRVGLRKVNVFGSSHLATEYDLFLQPGFASAFVLQPGRSFDIGMRLTHRYAVPASRFTLGLNFEAVLTSYSVASGSSDLTGVLAPWASYRMSSFFSTQHWIYGFYKHLRGEGLDRFSWDITGMPYLQNGVSLQLNEQLSVSVLVNHYLLLPLSLGTTWSSCWLAFKI